MKYCPSCQTKYDEEILRFCTKDGSPLIEEDLPQFTELPSESVEDHGEETVIRRKTPVPEPQPDPESEDFSDDSESTDNSQRIVIPTAESEKQNVRQYSPAPAREMPPPAQSNTLVVVLLTIIGTFVVMSAGFGVFWVLSSQNDSDNSNVNSNINALDENVNANLDLNNNTLFDPNINLNANLPTILNTNVNTNINANTRTPTPTPTPTPSPSPDDDENSNSRNNSSTPTPRPSGTPRPSVSPSPTPSPANRPTNSPVNVGVLNERAINLRKPSYPQIAREMRAAGRVQVQVLVDERGNVDSAKAISGHPLLRSPAENAAKNSKFNPATMNGRNVKSTGYVIYDFVRDN